MTTVHPLLANFDRLGWLRGALASRREWRAIRAVGARKAPQARYGWTLFKPDAEALEVLAAGLRERRFSLTVGFRASLEDASAAFEHVTMGKAGRAVLRP